MRAVGEIVDDRDVPGPAEHSALEIRAPAVVVDDENIAPASWLDGALAAVETATDGLADVRALFTPEECAHYIRHCGYRLSTSL